MIENLTETPFVVTFGRDLARLVLTFGREKRHYHHFAVVTNYDQAFAPGVAHRTTMQKPSIAVLGGGNGAIAAAGDLACRGFEVRLALRDRARHAELFECRRVTLDGLLSGVGRLAAVTDDYAEAARGSRLIFVFAPATFQTEILVRALDGLSPGQVVCFAAGTFSCWPAAHALAEAGGPDVTFAEMATLPYGVRVAGPAAVRFALSAAHLPTGVFPAARTEEAVARLREAYPAVEPVEDSLAAGLLNFDGALHAPLTLMNAGAIEGMTEFDVHVQGATPAVVRVSLSLDGERIAIREALGYHTHHWPLLDYYEGREMFYGVAYRQTRDRSVWNERIDFSHRYVTEDVALGLVLWSSLGRRLGVPTPLSGAFVAIASMINGVDYNYEGRTLDRLGLADVPLDVLRARLLDGGRV